jgi:hypothetical protein
LSFWVLLADGKRIAFLKPFLNKVDVCITGARTISAARATSRYELRNPKNFSHWINHAQEIFHLFQKG